MPFEKIFCNKIKNNNSFGGGDYGDYGDYLGDYGDYLGIYSLSGIE